MAWIATAIVGGAVVSGIVQSNAASSAAKAQSRAADNQLQAAERQYWNDIALATEMKQVLMGLSPTERIEKQADLDKALAKLEAGEDVETARLDIARLQSQMASQGLIDTRFTNASTLLSDSATTLFNAAGLAHSAQVDALTAARDTNETGFATAQNKLVWNYNNAKAAVTQGYGEAKGYLDSFANEMQGQYDRWNSIYGSLQENLGEFYNNLTPQMLSATNLQVRQREYQTAVDSVRKSFAQRGVASGAQSAIEAGMAMENAKARAQIRADAPFQVAEAQTGFLTSTGNIRNAYTDDLQQAKESQAANAVNQGQALSEIARERGKLVTELELNRTATMAALDLARGNIDAGAITQQGQAAAANSQAQAGLELDRLNAETNALNAAARNTSAAGQNLTSTAINVAGQQGQIQANLAQQQANAITGVLNTGMYALGKYGTPATSATSAPVYDGFTGQRVM